MKKITLELADTPATRRMLQYLRDQLVSPEVDHWDGEYNESSCEGEESDEQAEMLQAWEALHDQLKSF